MKNSIFLLLLATAAFGLSFRADQDSTAKTDDAATIYVYRGGQFFAAGVNYVIQADGKDICRLSNNKYVEYSVKPGKIMIGARRGGLELFKRETEIEITAEAGKKYYIKGDVKSSIMQQFPLWKL